MQRKPLRWWNALRCCVPILMNLDRRTSCQVKQPLHLFLMWWWWRRLQHQTGCQITPSHLQKQFQWLSSGLLVTRGWTRCRNLDPGCNTADISTQKIPSMVEVTTTIIRMLNPMRRAKPLTSASSLRCRGNPTRTRVRTSTSQARCEQIQENCKPTSQMRQLKCLGTSRAFRSPSSMKKRHSRPSLCKSMIAITLRVPWGQISILGVSIEVLSEGALVNLYLSRRNIILVRQTSMKRLFKIDLVR
jgi:hypothetical protein